ncbi:MAG: hypothetical protein ACO3NZ_06850 [Pirellulales bacterium]|jgi:hypothetical protein
MSRRRAMSVAAAVVRSIIGCCAVCCCLLTLKQADASCGDWLAGHADSASAHESPTGDSGNMIADAADPQSERSAPSRPCSGPSCRQAPAFPLIPTDAPGVPLELERDAVLRACGSELSLHAHATILVDDVLFSSASADQLERPPRAV